MPVADCGAFEVDERSEVGALESPPVGRLRDYEEIIVRGVAEIRNPLHQTRQTNKTYY